MAIIIYAIVTASVNVNTPNLTPKVSIIIPPIIVKKILGRENTE